MGTTIFILILIGLLSTPTHAQFNQFNRNQNRNRQETQKCITPEDEYGECVTLSFCPQAAQVFKFTDGYTARQYVFALQRACGTRNIDGDPVICCSRPLNRPVFEQPRNPFWPTVGPFVTLQPVPLPWPETTTPLPTGNPFLPSTLRPTPAPTITTTTTAAPLITTHAMNPILRTCRMSDGNFGQCVPIKNCIPLVSKLNVPKVDPAYTQYLRDSNLSCGKVGTDVCCPSAEKTQSSDEIPRRLPTVAEGCGYSEAPKTKIVGGKVAKVGAWPWIALLAYDEASVTKFKCGGTLITARHVLTAAHCVRVNLIFVRLGEHDLSTDLETRHLDIPVPKRVKHPHYTPHNGRNDIALLYLKFNVEFTDLISPICMPDSTELRAKSYVATNPFVIGWGKTQEDGESATILNELMISVWENEVCRQSYTKVHLNITVDQFDASIICAGELGGGKDTCQGDSGGPLMTAEFVDQKQRYFLIGVVAYGVGCARPEIPGVYTSTQYFMDWINEQLQNTP